MAIKYSRKLLILDVEGLRTPTAAEKTQIAKQWAKSSQKKRGKSKSDYTYDVLTGQFVTKSTAAQKNIRLLQNRIKQLAAENRQLRRREIELRNRMADIERELEEREAQGDAASYASEGYDQDTADNINIADHNFEGVGGYEVRDDTIRAANEFRELLQDLSLALGRLQAASDPLRRGHSGEYPAARTTLGRLGQRGIPRVGIDIVLVDDPVVVVAVGVSQLVVVGSNVVADAVCLAEIERCVLHA